MAEREVRYFFCGDGNLRLPEQPTPYIRMSSNAATYDDLKRELVGMPTVTGKHFEIVVEAHGELATGRPPAQLPEGPLRVQVFPSRKQGPVGVAAAAGGAGAVGGSGTAGGAGAAADLDKQVSKVHEAINTDRMLDLDQYLDLIHMIRQEAASQQLKRRPVSSAPRFAPSASELTQPLLPK